MRSTLQQVLGSRGVRDAVHRPRYIAFLDISSTPRDLDISHLSSTRAPLLGSFPKRVPADLSVFLRPADKHIYPIPQSRLSSNFVHGGFQMSSSSSTMNSVLSLPPFSPSLGIELHLSFGSSNITYVLSLPLYPPAWAWSSTCPPPALYG